MSERIIEILLSRLIPFKKSPFKVGDCVSAVDQDVTTRTLGVNTR